MERQIFYPLVYCLNCCSDQNWAVLKPEQEHKPSCTVSKALIWEMGQNGAAGTLTCTCNGYWHRWWRLSILDRSANPKSSFLIHSLLNFRPQYV